jgi:F-type H+-transporting ATPase subunit b
MEKDMLDINLWLLFGSGIVFLLVLLRLNSCLYKPLFEHMDSREKSIAKDLEDAKSNSSDISSMLSEAEEIIAKAKHKASAIRDEAIVGAKKIADEKIEASKKTLEEKYGTFLKTLDEDKNSLKESLQSNMPMFQESLKLKISSI